MVEEAEIVGEASIQEEMEASNLQKRAIRLKNNPKTL